MRRNVKITGTAALLLVAPLLFAGCSGDAVTGTDLKKIEDVIEDNRTNKNESSDKDDEVNTDKDVKVELGESGSLPNGWPREAIVPKGEISYSGEVDGAYSVIMLSDNDGIESAIEEMKRSGFSETLNMGDSTGRIVSLEGAKWTVSMIVGEDEASRKLSVIYTATPN